MQKTPPPRFPKVSERHPLLFMNIAQFCGVLNDNIYKLAVIFFLIQLEGQEHAPAILSAAGAIFVVPFLLFSSVAGRLADTFSKNRIVIALKTTEVLILSLAVFAFAFRLTWGSYLLLFLLSTQSTFFSPSKYGIIPELVSKEGVSRANGLITSFTYLAIILGAFFASFLIEITHRNYILVGLFCVLVALIGWISSLGIKRTEPMGSKKKPKLFFLPELYRTLVQCRSEKHLLTVILGSSYFLFIGGFTQLNIIPFAIYILGFNEIAGGFLFLATASGIGMGAFVAGRASKREIQLGLSCLACGGSSLFFFLLGTVYFHPLATVFILILIGFAGGCFIVPLDAFIQIASPEISRGHVIAASNFLSFSGVLIASFLLYLFNQTLGISSAMSFCIIGLITLVVAIVLTFRLSDLVLLYTAKNLLQRWLKIQTVNLDLVKKGGHPLLMLENGSPLKAWLLCGLIPNLHILFPQYKKRRFPWFEKLFYSLHRIESPQKFEKLIDKSLSFKDPNIVPCIYLPKSKPVAEKETLLDIFKRKEFQVLVVRFEKNAKEKLTRILFSK